MRKALRMLHLDEIAFFLQIYSRHLCKVKFEILNLNMFVSCFSLQVLSPLSDSILAEKTVTVLDDKVKENHAIY